jgi:peptidoglycan/LPS O-acetylase OafA/YrhL
MNRYLDNVRKLLTRKTTSGGLIPEIDGFRFFAIGTVLLYHLNTHLKRVYSPQVEAGYLEGWLDNLVSRGSVGVDVFFAISGFILALPFARQRLFHAVSVDLKSYYLRRLTRLEPPYVISLIIFLLVHVMILHEQWPDIFPNFFASLFYVHNLVYNEWSKINPVAWSLEVEVQFYLLAPLLATLFGIRNPVWRRSLLVVIVVVSLVHYNLNYAWLETWHLRKSLFMHLHQFLIGFLFADFYLTDWSESLKTKSVWYDAVGLLALAALLMFNTPFVIYHDLIFGLALFVAFMALFKGRLMNAFFSNTWIVIIGGMCYSIYLLHYALIAFLADKTKSLFVTDWGYSINFGIQSLVVIPVVLVVSAFYFAMVERPCMDKDWPGKFWLWIKTKIPGHRVS